MQINKYVNQLPYFNYQQQIMTDVWYRSKIDILPPGEAVISQ